MDVKSRRALQFDGLEDRVYLSVAHGAHAHPTALNGSIQIPLPADPFSSTLSIVGNGNVSPLGPVSALGTLTSDGHGGGGGVVDLASGDGGIVLHVQATPAHGRHAPPHVRFTIDGGTGKFTNATGQGTATETTGAGMDMLVLKIHGTIRAGS